MNIWRFSKNSSPRNLRGFTQQMSWGLRYGNSLDETLASVDVALGHEPALSKAVSSGRLLSDAMTDDPARFTPVIIRAVAEGEKRGTLLEVFDRLTAYYEAEDTLVQERKKRLAYLGMLTVLAFCWSFYGVARTLFSSVDDMSGPSFEETLGIVSRPAPHDLSLMGMRWGLLLLAIFAGFLIERIWHRKFGSKISSVIMDTLFLGPYSWTADIARASRALGLLIDCGVSWDDAVTIAGTSCCWKRREASFRVWISSQPVTPKKRRWFNDDPLGTAAWAVAGNSNTSTGTLWTMAAQVLEEQLRWWERWVLPFQCIAVFSVIGFMNAPLIHHISNLIEQIAGPGICGL